MENGTGGDGGGGEALFKCEITDFEPEAAKFEEKILPTPKKEPRQLVGGGGCLVPPPGDHVNMCSRLQPVGGGWVGGEGWDTPEDGAEPSGSG